MGKWGSTTTSRNERFKKVSDILIDKKVSIHDKRDILVLKSNNTIVWLIGYIINDKFKVTTKTTRCYKIKFHGNN